MPLVLNGTTGVQDNSGAFVAGTAVASTSGTSIDFTSIPSWVKRVTVCFSGVSTSGASGILVQLGDSGGIENTGYTSTVNYLTNNTASATSTAGFVITDQGTANSIFNGILTLAVINSTTNSWVGSGTLSWTVGFTGSFLFGGSKSLSAVLDRVRITTVNGTDTFDAGSINILYE